MPVAYQPALAAEKARLEKIQTDVDKQLAAFNFAAAVKLVQDGKALKVPFETMCGEYTRAKSERTTAFNEGKAIEGKPICKFENDKLAVLLPQIDAMIGTDHAFTAARKLIEQYRWTAGGGKSVLTQLQRL